MRENVKHRACIPIVIFADEKEAEPKNVPETRRFTHLRSLSKLLSCPAECKQIARLGISTDLCWCLI